MATNIPLGWGHSASELKRNNNAGFATPWWKIHTLHEKYIEQHLLSHEYITAAYYARPPRVAVPALVLCFQQS